MEKEGREKREEVEVGRETLQISSGEIIRVQISKMEENVSVMKGCTADYH